jgi:hypothetical protein
VTTVSGRVAASSETGSTRFAPQAPAGLGPMGDDPARILSAFRPYWERLGEPARRLGFKHGNSLIKQARDLRDDGMVESGLERGHFQWRLTSPGIAIATEARRAETPKSGSVHKGAGLQGIAQKEAP